MKTRLGQDGELAGAVNAYLCDWNIILSDFLSVSQVNQRAAENDHGEKPKQLRAQPPTTPNN
jgi:hypothetical protein